MNLALGQFARNILRTARNAAFDVRFGGFLGGYKANPIPGANGTGATDYWTMPEIFRDLIKPNDVLVDVGCGYGRVLNWWLSRGHQGPIYGIESLPDVAMHVRRRLRRYKNVRVMTGDATELLPPNADLIYLFNPFDDERTLTALFDRIHVTYCANNSVTIVYYACVLLEALLSDPRWTVEERTIRLPRSGRFEDRHKRLAIIRPNNQCAAALQNE